MRVSVDLELCDRQAVCTGLAPSVFDIGEEGAVLVLQPEPPESLREACEDAAAACPMRAIVVTD
jgi:ferredoxin